MFGNILSLAAGRKRSPLAKSKPRTPHPELFRPTLEGLEDRCTPANKFLWNPAHDNSGTVINNLWSFARNWDIWTGTSYSYQSTATPGAGDSTVFDGTQVDPSDNNDCYQDVSPGVTIDNMQIIGGFASSIILSNPLTISGTSNPSVLSLSSGSAAIRGSASGQPAFRGTLNLAGVSRFAWNAGTIENLTVNATKTSATVYASVIVSDSTFGARTMIGSDINANGLLWWTGGNVSVANSAANSNININAGGWFHIEAPNVAWSVTTGDPTSYFKIKNNGMIRLHAQGTAQIKGDFSNYATTRLDLGILDLGGKAEQWAGTTELHDNTTIKVSGSNTILNIFYGSIIGQGTVEGNLALGFDPNIYGSMYSGATIDPGFTTTDPNTQITAYTPGTLTITQSFQMFGFGTSMTLNVTSAGADKVAVSSTAILSGTLNLTKDDDYEPDGNTDTPLVTSGSLNNSRFDSINYSGETAWWAGGVPVIVDWQYNTLSFDFLTEALIEE